MAESKDTEPEVSKETEEIVRQIQDGLRALCENFVGEPPPREVIHKYYVDSLIKLLETERDHVRQCPLKKLVMDFDTGHLDMVRVWTEDIKMMTVTLSTAPEVDDE